MELVFESWRFQKKVPDHVLIYWNMHSRAPLESLPLEKTLHIRFFPLYYAFSRYLSYIPWSC